MEGRPCNCYPPKYIRAGAQYSVHPPTQTLISPSEIFLINLTKLNFVRLGIKEISAGVERRRMMLKQRKPKGSIDDPCRGCQWVFAGCPPSTCDKCHRGNGGR